MHVLVPEDPVFKSAFLSLEQPLLYDLHYWYRSQLTAPQLAIVGAAYDSWGEIEQALPARFRAQGPETVVGDLDDDYVLEGVTGQRLTRLHAVDVSGQIGPLEACYMMLRQAQLDGWGDPLHAILRDLCEGLDLVDCLRRVLRVLCLTPPPKLLGSIRRAAPAGPVKSLSLNAAQQQEYQAYCEQVVQALSAGSRFTYDMHRMLYAM